MPAIAEQIEPAECYEEGDFVVYDDVPVWKEHVNHRDFGQPVPFDCEAMERVCRRSNERIEETGDYAPIVIRHTKDDGTFEPKVVGFAGPYHTRQLGKKKPVRAICARLRFFKRDLDEIKRYPRVSVEYWATKSQPTNGYLDPIALLGAETPELDLGIRYQKNTDSLVCCRYAAAVANPTAPAGANAFLPSDSRKVAYAKESPVMLSPEDLQQIVDALTPVIEAKLGEMTAPPDDTAPADIEPPPDNAGAPPDAGPPPAGAPDGNAPPDLGDGADDEPETKAAYQKNTRALRAQYAKAVEDNRSLRETITALSDRVVSLEKTERQAVRYSKLAQLEQQGYVFDMAEELDETINLNDDQFSKHLNRIQAKYQRVPTGGLPQEQPRRIQSADLATRARYAKEAVNLCDRERRKGNHISYEEALELAKNQANR